jgi:hypothetical protein
LSDEGHIDDDLYDQQANMATFRVLVNKIVPYIRGLSILYYEIYGEMDKFTVRRLSRDIQHILQFSGEVLSWVVLVHTVQC